MFDATIILCAHFPWFSLNCIYLWLVSFTLNLSISLDHRQVHHQLSWRGGNPSVEVKSHRDTKPGSRAVLYPVFSLS